MFGMAHFLAEIATLLCAGFQKVNGVFLFRFADGQIFHNLKLFSETMNILEFFVDHQQVLLEGVDFPW